MYVKIYLITPPELIFESSIFRNNGILIQSALNWKEICWKEQREKGRVDASLTFVEIVKFAMSFWCCSWCWLLEFPSFISRNLESQFNSESVFCWGHPGTLWCLTGAAGTGARSMARGWWCRSSSSKGLANELKTSLKDFSQLCLLCWETYRFLKSALRNNISFQWHNYL